jgi:phosphatidylserine/phosphatidylglycerophosphate/cardiolipin synthase-like enzyme
MTSRSRTVALIIGLLLLTCQASSAQERLCDPAFEECYKPLLQHIAAETAGIDAAIYIIEFPALADALISRYQAGVPVRLIVEPRSGLRLPVNQQILDRFKAAGIPMRYKVDDAIVHAKTVLLAGQNRVIFSSSNFGDADLRPYDPYVNYVDGAWFFTDDQAVVNSFKNRFDDLWTNTTTYGNYANIAGPLTRKYQRYPIDPAMNFAPSQSPSDDYGARMIALIDRETQQIDLTMYRLTDVHICDALLRALARGVVVRLLAEPDEYRFDATRRGADFSGPYNVDRMYAAGVQIRMRKHLGLTHQKSVSLYAQGLTIFGSSNWSWQSFNYQEEHNYFTPKRWFFQWFADQFNRKWNSSSEYEAFVPRPPATPVNVAPTNSATVGQSVLLNWEGGRWATKYDVYFGSNGNLSLVAADLITGTPGTEGSENYFVSNLQDGVTYCWRVVGKTMANQTAAGPTWCFRASSTAPAAAPPLQLLLDSAGSTLNEAATLTASSFVKDPFSIVNGEVLNPGADRNTRAIVFVRNLQLAPGELPSAVTVSLVDENNQTFDLPAETVTALPNTDFVQVVFRLPNNLALGKCAVTVKAHGQVSNIGTMRIRI